MYLQSMRSVMFAFGIAGFMLLSGCKHAARTEAISETCDTARIQQLEQRGYNWLAQTKRYDAHLVGHALIAISRSCNDPAVALPAGVNGAYLLAAVFHAQRDERQSVYWLGEGFKFLAQVRQHETESPALLAVYDQMQPRFLTLQTEVGSH